MISMGAGKFPPFLWSAKCQNHCAHSHYMLKFGISPPFPYIWTVNTREQFNNVKPSNFPPRKRKTWTGQKLRSLKLMQEEGAKFWKRSRCAKIIGSDARPEKVGLQVERSNFARSPRIQVSKAFFASNIRVRIPEFSPKERGGILFCVTAKHKKPFRVENYRAWTKCTLKSST